MSDLGCTQISAYLYGVTDEQVSALADDIAELLIHKGFNANGDMTCIVGAKGFEWPDKPEDFVELFRDEEMAVVVIPQPPDSDSDLSPAA